MENGLVTRWFLGVDSGVGFYSLYDSFAAGDGNYLRVIKGGPGCGKSAFLERVGSAAEKAGLDVEYILCPHAPESLDGVYLPALKTGWIDGSAPHHLDPMYFAATGDYLDLGSFCDVSAARERRDAIICISERCKGLHERASFCLRAAASASPEKRADLFGNAEIAAVSKRASAAAERELPRAKKSAAPGRITERFLSAVTCDGQVFLKDTFKALCGSIYVLDNRYGLAGQYICEMLRKARERGVDATLCLSPLDPAVPEAVVFPALSLGFIAMARDAEPDLEPYRHVRLDALVDPERTRALRKRLRADSKTKDALLEAAVEALQEAHVLHGELEALFRPFVDLDGVLTAADAEIAQVLK